MALYGGVFLDLVDRIDEGETAKLFAVRAVSSFVLMVVFAIQAGLRNWSLLCIFAKDSIGP